MLQCLIGLCYKFACSCKYILYAKIKTSQQHHIQLMSILYLKLNGKQRQKIGSAFTFTFAMCRRSHKKILYKNQHLYNNYFPNALVRNSYSKSLTVNFRHCFFFVRNQSLLSHGYFLYTFLTLMPTTPSRLTVHCKRIVRSPPIYIQHFELKDRSVANK